MTTIGSFQHMGSGRCAPGGPAMASPTPEDAAGQTQSPSIFGNCVGEQQAIRDNFLFERLPGHLEAS